MLLQAERALSQQLWQNSPGQKQAKSIMGQYYHKRFKTCIELSKNELRTIAGFMTGHCKLRKHLYNMGIEENSTCRFCELEDETPLHLLIDCGAVADKRMRSFDTYLLEEGQLPSLEPRQILNFIKRLGLSEVL